MLKKLLVIIIISAFVSTPYSFNAHGCEAELSAQKEKLENLSKEIEASKEKIKQVKLEYIESQKQLQKEVAEKTSALTETKRESSRKEILKKSKERQAELRKLYYQKKKPLTAEMHKLKLAHRQCRHKIKELEKMIQDIKEGGGPDYEYIEQMNDLRQELAELRDKHKKALAKLQNEVDAKIAALVDKEHRAKARKQILTDAKDKELRLHQDYSKEKELIAARMDKAKAAHRKRMKERRELRKEEEKVQGKGPSCNFGPAR